MENDFSYEQLSPRAFEQVAVAIAESVIGAGLEVYGPGPDGGREATWQGKINWSLHDPDDSDNWKGYTVVQVKQCQNPTQDPERDLAWLIKEVNVELKTWMDPESKRSQFPENLFIVTNIRLTPADPGGTMQKFDIYRADRLDHNYGTNRQVKTLRSRGLPAATSAPRSSGKSASSRRRASTSVMEVAQCREDGRDRSAATNWEVVIAKRSCCNCSSSGSVVMHTP